jgi:hypothetical protein
MERLSRQADDQAERARPMIQILKRSFACMLAFSLAQVSPVSIAHSTLITTGEIVAGSLGEGFKNGHVSSLLDLPEI